MARPTKEELKRVIKLKEQVITLKVEQIENLRAEIRHLQHQIVTLYEDISDAE